MSEDRHSENTSLSELSSQDKPAAHADQVARELARKSVRPGAFSQFGSHWITGGAVVAVAVISVLLVQTVSQQPDLHAPGRDAMAPSSEVPSGVKTDAARLDALSSDPPLTEEQLRQARSALKTRFLDREELQALEENVQAQESRTSMKQSPVLAGEDFASAAAIPEKEVVVSAQETRTSVKKVPALAVGDSATTAAMPDEKAIVSEQEPRPPLKQAPALAGEAAVGATTAAPLQTKDEHAGTAAKAQVLAADVTASATVSATGVKYYLQAGSFRRMTRANKLKTELAELGFSSDIKAARIEGKGIYYRVLAGPFTDRAARAISKRKLAELGIETRMKIVRK